MNYLCF